MIYFKLFALNLALLAMLPILIPQALWVRSHALRLPEAEGSRKFQVPGPPCQSTACNTPAVSQAGKDFNVLIIGDSAAAGVGAAHQNDALSGALFRCLTGFYCSDVMVTLDVEATTGFTSSDVLQRLSLLAPKRVDVALVSVGVNDVTKFISTRQFSENIRAIYHLLRNEFSCQHVIFSALPPMHAFPAIPQPLRYVLGSRARLLNFVLESHINTLPKAEVLNVEIMRPDMDVNQLNKSGLMAEDGFHPSPKGYTLWAQQVAERIKNVANTVN